MTHKNFLKPHKIKILVTGASGFIGSYVIDNLLDRGFDVIAFDHKHAFPHALYKDGVVYFTGDTRDYTSVSEAVALSGGVIHLAGVLGTQETVNEPKPAVETNILGGLNVFQAIRHYKVRGVYIAVGNHFMNNSYSISKTTAERFALMFNKEHKTEIAVVRGLNVFGPRQKAYPVKKIMPNFVIPALKKEPIQIYGDGEQVMDMIYAKDIADVLVRALVEDHGNYTEAFEAGVGGTMTVNQIADQVLEIAESKIASTHLPMRPGEIPGSVVVGKPETLMPLYDGKEPKFTDFRSALVDTIEWYSQHLSEF